MVLELVLFFGFVVPIVVGAVKACRTNSQRERRRRAFNRDQSIRVLESEVLS